MKQREYHRAESYAKVCGSKEFIQILMVYVEDKNVWNGESRDAVDIVMVLWEVKLIFV